jgi:hypothetical protein
MKPLIIAQELARKNNEAAAVHAAYRQKRKLRRLLGSKLRAPGLPRAKSKGSKLAKRLDDIDWRAAEREARPVRAVGFFLPKKS